MKLTIEQLKRIADADIALNKASKALLSVYSDIIQDCPYRVGDRVMARKKNEPGTPECPAQIVTVDVQDGAYSFVMQRYSVKDAAYGDSIYDYEPTRKIHPDEWLKEHPRSKKL